MAGAERVALAAELSGFRASDRAMLQDPQLMLRPLATADGLVAVTATYHLDNPAGEQRLDLVFATGSVSAGFRVALDGRPGGASPASRAESPRSCAESCGASRPSRRACSRSSGPISRSPTRRPITTAKLSSPELTARVHALQAEDRVLAGHIEALRGAGSLLLLSWEHMMLEVRGNLSLRLNPNGRAAMLAVIDERLDRTEVRREVLETLRRRVHEAMPPQPVQLGDLPDEIVDDVLRAAMQQARFADLAEIWRNETAFLSSTSAIVRHPAYREIIQMGPSVVPLILRELARRPGH